MSQDQANRIPDTLLRAARKRASVRERNLVPVAASSPSPGLEEGMAGKAAQLRQLMREKKLQRAEKSTKINHPLARSDFVRILLYISLK